MVAGHGQPWHLGKIRDPRGTNAREPRRECLGCRRIGRYGDRLKEGSGMRDTVRHVVKGRDRVHAQRA
jgi:hypothetical protein